VRLLHLGFSPDTADVLGGSLWTFCLLRGGSRALDGRGLRFLSSEAIAAAQNMRCIAPLGVSCKKLGLLIALTTDLAQVRMSGSDHM